MERKKFTKEQQIRGLRKALKNPRTPRHFLPSMKKRLARLLALVLFLLFVPAVSRAQYQGTFSPQLIQATVASGVSCTGSAQTFVTSNPALNALGFRNIGQTIHWANAQFSGANTNASLQIQGIDSGGAIYTLSDTAMASGSSGGGQATVFGSGAYSNIQLLVTCSGGTFTLSYSGSSSGTIPVAGFALSETIDKAVVHGAPENTTFASPSIIPPFGMTGGVLVFQYSTAAISGSTLTVACNAQALVNTYNLQTFTISNNTNVQQFPVLSFPCSAVTVTYITGTGGAGTIAFDYLFLPPGQPNSTFGSYSHITATTAQNVKNIGGVLLSVTVNTPAAGTISIFDLPQASCTGTPATNTVAVITATATAPLGTIPYNLAFQNGICVKASVAMDITVSSQ